MDIKVFKEGSDWKDVRDHAVPQSFWNSDENIHTRYGDSHVVECDFCGKFCGGDCCNWVAVRGMSGLNKGLVVCPRCAMKLEIIISECYHD